MSACTVKYTHIIHKPLPLTFKVFYPIKQPFPVWGHPTDFHKPCQVFWHKETKGSLFSPIVFSTFPPGKMLRFMTLQFYSGLCCLVRYSNTPSSSLECICYSWPQRTAWILEGGDYDFLIFLEETLLGCMLFSFCYCYSLQFYWVYKVFKGDHHVYENNHICMYILYMWLYIIYYTPTQYYNFLLYLFGYFLFQFYSNLGTTCICYDILLAHKRGSHFIFRSFLLLYLSPTPSLSFPLQHFCCMSHVFLPTR